MRRIRPRALALGAVVAALVGVSLPGPARAGRHTYFDVFPGDRAAAMGGAYTALADDGSGGYWNPAGLARIPYAEVALSASAFAVESRTFERTYFGQDLVREGSSFYPTSFGALWRWEQLVVGLSVAVPEWSEIRSRQDFDAVEAGDFVFDFDLDFRDDSTQLLVGPTLGLALGPRWSLGLTLYYATGSRDFTSFTRTSDSVPPPGTAPETSIFVVTSEDELNGFTGVLGVQWRPDDAWSIGLALRPPTTYDHDTKDREAEFFSLEDLGLFPLFGAPTLEEGAYVERVPASATLGVAWTDGETLTLSGDLSVHLREDYTIEQLRVVREATWNVRAGLEWFFTEGWPLRLGAYTNRSAAPRVRREDPGAASQVHGYGFTLGTAWITERSELALSVRHGFLIGEFVEIGLEENPAVTDVHGSETSVVLGSRYKF